MKKTPGAIIILHNCTKNQDHTLIYTVPEIWHVLNVIVIFPFGQFCPFCPKKPTKAAKGFIKGKRKPKKADSGTPLENQFG